MATETDIANIGLDALGLVRISDIDTDATAPGVAMENAFDDVRDEVLRAHPWNCAMKRATLAENLLLYSEQFNQTGSWTATNATVTANQIAAPRGGAVADLLTDADGTNAGTVAQAITVPNDALSWTLSIYIKVGTAAESAIRLALSGGTGVTTTAVVTWTSGVPTITNGTVTAIGNGWYRAVLSVLNNATGNGTLTATVYPAGTTGSAQGTVYVWGAQVNSGTSAGGYALTTAAAIRPVVPDSGYSWGLPLPADFLRMYEVDEGDPDYKIENGYVLSRSASVSIRYVFQLTDTTMMDPLLRNVIGLSLAKRLCYQLKASESRYDQIEKSLRRALGDARSTDAIEDGRDSYITDEWVAARYSETVF